MTNPVPNLQSKLVDKNGMLIPPWNSFFQQLVQAAPAVANVKSSPFQANANGSVVIKGATTITFTRGTVDIILTGQEIIPIRIGDTVSWTGNATVQFLGA
jgi:hypothetical protein